MDYRGGEYIYSVLSNDTDVTDIVGTSVYNARMVPQTDTSAETINCYQSGTYNAAEEFFQTTWSIDCRAGTEQESQELAQAVESALNRKSASVGGYLYFGTISILPTIQPADDADVYNTPVEIIARRR